MWTALNSASFAGILIAGFFIGQADWTTALAFGIPSGLVFGITYMRGFPLAFGRDNGR
jgi:hypothetical protein